MKISVVVPCYKEEEVIAALHSRVSAVCSQYDGHEIVLVDDGSPDETWLRIRELSERDEHVLGVRLSRNHGHQLALSAGLAHATGDRILVIDADLQDPPELLPKMMEIMDAGADVVYGQRRSRQGIPAWKRLAYKAYYKLLAQLAGSEIPPDTGDFRLITRRIALLLTEMPEQYRFIRGMVSWLGFNQQPLLYDREARQAGESNYTLRKLVRLGLDGITSFSIKPLRIASILAFLLATAALCGLLFIVISWWHQRPIQGWASLVVTVLFLGAMQLFVLGIIGEYLGRLFIESKRRPLYMIAETIGGRSSDAGHGAEVAARQQ